MRSFIVGLLLLVATVAVKAQIAEYPVISEVRYYEISGVNHEFVEIYNPTGFAVDISGWKIQYRSSGGAAFSDKLTFNAGQTILSHGFILFGGTTIEDETGVAPDYLSTVAMGLGNSGGHVRIIDDSGTEIDLIGWNGATWPEGSTAGTTARGGSFERKAFETSTEATMNVGGADALEGNGWDSQDNSADFVIHDAEADVLPQSSSSSPEPDEPLTDGSGTAACSVNEIDAPGPVDFSVTVAAGEHLLETVVLEIPEGWAYESLVLDGNGFIGSSVSSDGNTITVSGTIVDGEEYGIFGLQGVTVPTATEMYTLSVRTAVVGGIASLIQSSPQVQVLGDALPIDVLHENNTNGLPLLLGQTVVVRGVVTASDQLGPASYMQDETGGIVCYGSGFSGSVNVGDDVTVVGTVTHFNGLVELTPVEVVETHATGVDVEPIEVTCTQISNQGAGGEPYEGMLVRVNGVLVNGTGTWAGNTNYDITDSSGSTVIRIDTNCELVGTPIPADAFDIIALVGQYDFSAPHHSGYQVLPRFTEDLIVSAGPGISGGPWESDHQTDSITLSWETGNPGTTIIIWGVEDGVEADSLEIEVLTTEHEYTLSGLDAGTPHWARVGSANESGANMTGTYWFSTVSDPSSPGTIEVFFTQDIESEVAAEGNEAIGNHDVKQEIIDLIDGAQNTLDLALYSLNIFDVGQAIIDAHDRGVAVRFIYDDDHSQGTVGQIEDAGVTVIDDSYGTNDGDGLQHNKIIIVDARDEDPSNDKVWTGSLNLIDQPSGYGINAKQNSMLISDQAVARAYTREFNEMWGSDSITPNSAQSRFGANKINDTPHYFLVGGREVEVWFSPGDNVSQRIVNYIGTAEESVYFCILVFTRNEIGYAMQDAMTRGADVWGVFNDEGDEYSEWENLTSWGADIYTDVGSGILHHKYMTVDAGNPLSDPLVISGSYNWSNSAESRNNENIVVVHDFLIANQYAQEFAFQYHAAGGQGDVVGVENTISQPDRFSLDSVYPNPFNPVTSLNFTLPVDADMELKVFNVLGREVKSEQLGNFQSGNNTIQLDLSSQSSGVYFLQLAAAGQGISTAKVLLVK
jgi:phosphatidylserine/phosphatidylglycerophosphate/cardiolipin synthase-like enzyme